MLLYHACRLQQWVKRKILDAPSEADAEPTASIRCPHGQLLPEQAAGAKRVLVPEDLWLFLHEDAIAVKPDDPTGVPTFPSDARQCSLCSEELSEVAVMEDSIRSIQFHYVQVNFIVDLFEGSLDLFYLSEE